MTLDLPSASHPFGKKEEINPKYLHCITDGFNNGTFLGILLNYSWKQQAYRGQRIAEGDKNKIEEIHDPCSREIIHIISLEPINKKWAPKSIH